MNIIDYNIMNALFESTYTTQRKLAEEAGYSLGKVNQSLSVLKENDFVTEDNKLTDKALKLSEKRRPSNAIILAAGMGMRMIPLNTMISKGLIEVNGEILIERLIRQLHQVGIEDITIVVGFMKESYDYLIDKFGVNLVINTLYNEKNNLHTLNLVSDRISNTYIIPCDLWCKENPFSDRELYSWFMVTDSMDDRSYLRVNRKQELVEIDPEEAGNDMVGISYILREDALDLIHNLHDMDKKKRYAGSFWEDALMKGNRLSIWANVVNKDNVIEINSYQQVKDMKNNPDVLDESIIRMIAGILGIGTSEIEDIYPLKKGLTNRSMHFKALDKEYVARLPYHDIPQFIDRKKEKNTYEVLKGSGMAEDVIYLDENTGIKISRFLDTARKANMKDENDIKLVMNTLKTLHGMNLKVEHDIDVFRTIEAYEKLRKSPSLYRDYEKTKGNVFMLKDFLDSNKSFPVLCHSEAVSDNTLIDEKGRVTLIDWEYAGMADPNMDLAMTAIYSGFDKEETDNMLSFYYGNKLTDLDRKKVYAYMAACGLLWSNWCEYKTSLGVEFGEYAMKQYRYAKDYYRYAINI